LTLSSKTTDQTPSIAIERAHTRKESPMHSFPLPSSEPDIVPMTITPELAKEWLETRNTNNRPLRKSKARQYARDIREGRWDVTHQGIAFDINGVILDGQQRLKGIALAGVPVKSFVGFNFSPKTIANIDQNTKRTICDSLVLGGKHGKVTSHGVATLNVMIGGFRGRAELTPHEADEKMQMHREAVSFALDAVPSGRYYAGIGNSITRGVIARAFYSVDRQRIREFAEMLSTGIISSERLMYIGQLRQYLQANQAPSATGNAEYRERYSLFPRR